MAYQKSQSVLSSSFLLQLFVFPRDLTQDARIISQFISPSIKSCLKFLYTHDQSNSGLSQYQSQIE